MSAHINVSLWLSLYKDYMFISEILLTQGLYKGYLQKFLGYNYPEEGHF